MTQDQAWCDFDENPEGARYHGCYYCPECLTMGTVTARPRAGCSGGRCQECGDDREWYDVIASVGIPTDDSGRLRRLTESEVCRYFEQEVSPMGDDTDDDPVGGSITDEWVLKKVSDGEAVFLTPEGHVYLDVEQVQDDMGL